MNKVVIILIVCTLVLAIYILTPVEIEGIVDHKLIIGCNENTCEEILNRPHPDAPWISVDNKDFEKFFSPTDKNVFVNDSIKEFLERKYTSINYCVAVQVNSEDPLNDVPKGETFTYFVSIENFNKVKIGNKVKCKVSRYRIDKITILE
ncbi:MAG: hypothetical protein ACC612_12160 [Methanomethylovorans sp.]|uniref:hypothetical protein n=1 Tax=Methanomethylovorans sp. TaxID=2758717 RepID=UPI003530BBED